ncbi:hypothetical protein BDN72DRAFT_763541, partial [Pluteus cervinus]
MDTQDSLFGLRQFISSFSSSSPVADHCTDQELLDTLIGQVENALALLKKRRNSLSPITRLSSDILLDIFQYIQPRSRRFGFVGKRTSEFPFAEHVEPDHFQWVKAVTHVCSRWRDLAINSPTLWTTITFPHPLCTSEVLDRSRLAPL